MNVNSGGPHLLLFERDQQLTALLTSELQLAGYECHAARTAVEVFDAIARYPIRLVLVNLAQAAAGRREFWVALDAQRRGRGVQVFTFRCMNLAGYGPDDPDERGRNVMADMEVDGMLGVMNLVNAVRARIPGSITGSSPRIPATPVASMQAGTREGTSAGTRESKDAPQAPLRVPTVPPTQAGVMPSATVTGQATSPLPLLVNNGVSTPSSVGARESGGLSAPAGTLPPALQHSQPPVSGLPVPQPGLPASSMPGSPTVAPSTPPLPAGPGNTPSSFTDKIRAVIYPSSRNSSQVTAGQEMSRDPAWGTSKPALHVEPQTNGQNLQYRSSTNSSTESGLEQLSRMVREQGQAQGTAPTAAQERAVQQEQQVQPGGQAAGNPSSISAMSLRASPIQDIALERGTGGFASGETSRQFAGQQAEPSLGAVSFNSHVPPDASSQPVAPRFIEGVVPPSTPALSPTPPPAMSPPDSLPVSPPTPVQAPKSDLASLSMSTPVSAATSVSRPARQENEGVVEQLLADAQKGEPSSLGQAQGTAPTGSSAEVAEPISNFSRPAPIDRPEESSGARALVEQVQASMQGVIRRNEFGTSASTDETLLNIVQSFPPMPSPAQSPQQVQPPVLSGRATRSLGSVLLEGHLVPQHRLEVAQQIQRMLRGVDMNYQLGEILLMFKLLTPDQLLAASLVSYGLISTMQISALGRIRQELHAIGLEYDLESLLVLFRILSPEQLREVRASWSA